MLNSIENKAQNHERSYSRSTSYKIKPVEKTLKMYLLMKMCSLGEAASIPETNV
jgi:hypothetical protein